MNTNKVGAWWASLGIGGTPDTAETDYADLGTAFGLDASMAPPPDDDGRAVADTPAAPAHSDATRRR